MPYGGSLDGIRQNNHRKEAKIGSLNVSSAVFFKDRRMRKQGFFPFVILALSLLLVHCAPEYYPGPNVFHDEDGAPLSGATAEDGSRYTGGNDPRLLQIKPSPAPAAGSLQRSITGVEISSPKDQKDDVLKVQLRLPNSPPAELHFMVPRLSSSIEKRTVTSIDPQGFEISGQLERKDGNVVEATFNLVRTSTSGQSPPRGRQDRAQILARAYHGVTRFRPSLSPMPLPPSLSQQISQTRELERASIHNFTVVQGPAFYQVDLHDRNHQSNLRLTGEAKQTGTGRSFPVAARTGPTTPAPQRVELIGNPGNVDGTAFLFNFFEGAESTSAVIEVVSEKLNRELDQPETVATRGVSQNSFLRTKVSADRPLTQTAMAHFDRNFSLPGVQKKIREVQDARADMGRQFRDILLTAFHLTGAIEAIYEGFDVPPPLFFLTLRESRFFKRNTLWQVDPTGPNEDSLGPMQLTFATAKSAGMKVIANGKGKPAASSADERLYVITSLCGAAEFLSGLLRDFSISDATLGVMAYNTGQYGAVRRVLDQRGISNSPENGYEKFRANISRYQLTYVEAARLGTLEKARYEYVDTFLAYYFVNGDTSGIEMPTASSLKVPPQLLVPTAGVSNPKCAEIWKKQTTNGVSSQR